jgi:hypothetical protein
MPLQQKYYVDEPIVGADARIVGADEKMGNADNDDRAAFYFLLCYSPRINFLKPSP